MSTNTDFSPFFLSTKPGGRRQGYMGHLTRIANAMMRFGEGDEQVRSETVEGG